MTDERDQLDQRLADLDACEQKISEAEVDFSRHREQQQFELEQSFAELERDRQQLADNQKVLNAETRRLKQAQQELARDREVEQ